MTAAVAPRQSTVTAKVTFAAIEVTGALSNAAVGGAEKRYYIKCAATGQDDLKSQLFSPSHDGKFVWDNVLFPASGTWTVTLNNAADDSVAATNTLTVA